MNVKRDNSLGNHFTLSIRGHVAVNPKLQGLKDKIQHNEQLLQQVEPDYKECRSKFEKFLNLRGAELLEEWGLLGSEFKLVRKHKKEETKGTPVKHKTEVDVLDMDHLDRSYLGSSVRTKRKTAVATKKKDKIKHEFTKSAHPKKADDLSATQKVESTSKVAQDIKEETKQAPVKRSESDEKVRERIEKRHLHKRFHNNEIIHEREEDLLDTPDKDDSPEDSKTAGTHKNGHGDDAETPSDDYGAGSLTSDALRSNNLGAKRTGLGSSLINLAMQDLTHSSKVKSVYNSGAARANQTSVGGMFNKMGMGNTMSGMFMMNNNPMMSHLNYNANDDNCSLVSGNTFQTFQNFANPMSLSQKKN